MEENGVNQMLSSLKVPMKVIYQEPESEDDCGHQRLETQTNPIIVDELKIYCLHFYTNRLFLLLKEVKVRKEPRRTLEWVIWSRMSLKQ